MSDCARIFKLAPRSSDFEIARAITSFIVLNSVQLLSTITFEEIVIMIIQGMGLRSRPIGTQELGYKQPFQGLGRCAYSYLRYSELLHQKLQSFVLCCMQTPSWCS